MNDISTRIERVNRWYNQVLATGDPTNPPLADIACVANFAKKRLQVDESKTDELPEDYFENLLKE